MSTKGTGVGEQTQHPPKEITFTSWLRMIDPQRGVGWWHKQAGEGSIACGIVLVASPNEWLDVVMIGSDRGWLGISGDQCPQCLYGLEWTAEDLNWNFGRPIRPADAWRGRRSTETRG